MAKCILDACSQDKHPTELMLKVNSKEKVLELRFKEFTEEWEEKRLSKVTSINPKNKELPEKFIYIDLACNKWMTFSTQVYL